ncbi:hypothetical protein KC19_4G188700 [Ceratodon purpureus]|uniref:Uncharacterized protein n=1 Tax=Ceratodon purpureus TaxID=3225 RepID=A0A8T0ICL6_CERPU|nr:hypothetical protein KC19_4G188700 [Ceratodon purpureus]
MSMVYEAHYLLTMLCQAWSEFSFGCSSWLPTSILSKGLCLSWHAWVALEGIHESIMLELL